MRITLERYERIMALKGENARYVAMKHNMARAKVYEIWNGTLERPQPERDAKLRARQVTEYLAWPAPRLRR